MIEPDDREWVDTNGNSIKGDQELLFRANGKRVSGLRDLFKNSSVFLICNGPSFLKVDRSRLEKPGMVTMGLNNGAHGFRPNFWVSVDAASRFVPSIWRDPAILKFVPVGRFNESFCNNPEGFESEISRVGDCPGLIGFVRKDKFEPERWIEEKEFNWGNSAEFGGGRSVMLTAIKLCHVMGFRKVFLVGCDFRMSTEYKYWFDEARSDRAIRNNNAGYRRLNEYFSALKPRFDEIGFEVYNTYEDSGLNVFPYAEFDKAVDQTRIVLERTARGMYEALGADMRTNDG